MMLKRILCPQTTGYVSFHAEGEFRADEDMEQTKANIDPRDLIEATQSGSTKRYAISDRF